MGGDASFIPNGDGKDFWWYGVPSASMVTETI